MTYSESDIIASDGIRLFTCEWRPVSDIKGVICLVHGLGDHSGRYKNAVESFVETGYAFMASDIRGHGKSEGPKGHTPSYRLLMDDIGLLLARAAKLHTDKPCYLYGHSMGGNLVLNYVMRRKPPLSGAIVTSPWLKLAAEPELPKVAVSRLLNILWPTFKAKNGLRSVDLFHRSDGQEYVKDPLSHHFISARLFVSIRQAGRWVLENAPAFSLPLLLMHGSDDKITSPAAGMQFSNALPELCTFKLWEGCYHELHNEPQWPEIFDFAYEWINNPIHTFP